MLANRLTRSLATLLALLITAFLANPPLALAADGVAEINQTCATQTGCFPGDSAGFPVSITQIGSYKLTSNLNVGNSSTIGIDIATSSVSIDLNGFTLNCTVIQFPVISPCSDTPNVVADAIRSGSAATGIRISNGIIQGVGGGGIDVGQASVDSVSVHNVGSTGIKIESGSVRNSIVEDAQGSGISVNSTSLITGNHVRGTGFSGILIFADTIVRGNLVADAGQNGIHLEVFVGSEVMAAVIEKNVVRNSGSSGMLLESPATVRGNSVVGSGNSGLSFTSEGLAADNTLIANNLLGISTAGADVGYRGNVISGNGLSTVSGVGLVNLSGNACNGSTSCP